MGQKVDNLGLPDGDLHPNAAHVFGAHLREWIQATGLNQQQLSKKLPVHASYVSHMVNGRKTPGLELLANMVVELYFALKQRGVEWRATEVREVAKALGYGWGKMRGQMVPYLQGHISEEAERVLAWWDSARPYPAQTELPGVPRNLIARAEFDEVKVRVLATEDGWHARWPVVIVSGATGVGKTTLAAEIARSPEVRDGFSDGVVWVRGSEQSVEQALKDACWQAGIKGEWRTRWATTWRAWLALPERRVLVILDDVDAKSREILRELTISLNDRSVLLVTTQLRDEVREEVVAYLAEAHRERPPEKRVYELFLHGFQPEEGLRFMCRLFKAYGCAHVPPREMWEHIGKKVHWHPLALRLVVARGCEVGWKQALAELAKGLTGRYEELREMVERYIERLPDEERARLRTLIKYMKYGDAFGVKYAAAVWGMEEEEALVRIRRLARLGLVEEVRGYPLGLGLGKQWWRVIPIVFALYHEPHSDTWRMWFCRRAAYWMAQRRPRHLTPPRLFKVLIALWNIPLFIEWGVALLIQLMEVLKGPLGWKERWAHFTLINRASTRMKALWQTRGIFPPEEYWLLDAHADLVSFALLGVAVLWGGSAFWVPRWLIHLPALTGLIFLLGWIAIMILIWFLVTSFTAWLWWTAYLTGVEALDLRVLIGITRKLTGRPEIESIRFEAHKSSSESVPDECKDL